MHRLTPAVVLSLAAVVAAQDPADARVDRVAMTRHYAAVEAELRQAPAPADASVAARRQAVIDHLRAYRERGDFVVDHEFAGARVPRFVDAEGRRCAVAWLLDRTGHGELTLAIRDRCNTAWVAELATDPVLGAWLDTNGLSLAEAVRIQAPGSGSRPREIELPPPENSAAAARADVRAGRPVSSGPARTTVPTESPLGRGGIATAASGGVVMEELGEEMWLDWWEWNRGAFEPLAPIVPPAAAGATIANDPRRRDVETLLAELARAPDAIVRAAAVQALGRIGGDVELEPFLADGAREVHLSALLSLGGSRDATDAHALATRASTKLPGETLAVALAGMAMLDAGSVQRALAHVVDAGLADTRANVHAAAAIAATTRSAAERREAARAALRTASTAEQRADAAQLLGADADGDDVATLTKLANDKGLEVRRSAALALGRSKHELALPALQSAFELEHENLTRALQLLAIGDHGGAAARDFLLQQLESGAKPLRAHAALALGLWGRGRGAADVGDRVVTAFGKERNRDQQGAYLLALGLLRHAPARELLGHELTKSTKSSVRGAAAAALGLLGDRADVAVVAGALAKDSCPWVRQQAARALQQLGADAVPALLTAMRGDADATVQRAAAFALGGIADVRATEALRAFAVDDDASAVARVGAVLGLGRAFRRHEARLPSLRYQRNWLALPAITAWAFAQEL